MTNIYLSELSAHITPAAQCAFFRKFYPTDVEDWLEAHPLKGVLFSRLGMQWEEHNLRAAVMKSFVSGFARAMTSFRSSVVQNRKPDNLSDSDERQERTRVGANNKNKGDTVICLYVLPARTLRRPSLISSSLWQFRNYRFVTESNIAAVIIISFCS
jgi:hypothetical protein